MTLEADVIGVREQGDEVVVTWIDAGGDEQSERFAGCVLAVPAPIAARVHTDLAPSRREFLERTPYNAMTVVSLGLSKPPPGLDCAFYAHPETEEIFTSVFEHNKLRTLVPEGKGLVSLYPNDEMSKALLDQEDDAVIDQVVKAARTVLPPMEDEIEFAIVHHWELGAFRSRVGYYRDLREFHAAPDRLIQFAGDYFAPTSMNTASSAGQRASRLLVRALGGVGVAS